MAKKRKVAKKKCDCGLSVAAHVMERHKKGDLHKARMVALANGKKPPTKITPTRKSTGKKTTRRRRKATARKTTTRQSVGNGQFDVAALAEYVQNLEEMVAHLTERRDAALAALGE